jgi:hypothetical protein
MVVGIFIIVSFPLLLVDKRVGKTVGKDSSLIKPIFGAAGRMGKIASEAPALEAYPKLKGSFCADLSATRSYGPSNLGKPNNILKGFGGYGRPNL